MAKNFMKDCEENGTFLPEVAMNCFFTVHRLHHMICEHQISDISLHHGQHRMLMYLSLLDEIPSQKQIADSLEISPAAVAVTLKKLESGGFIRRETLKDDNRFNKISITNLGRDVVEKSTRAFHVLDETMFEGIGEEELEQFIATLRHVSDNLKNAMAQEKETNEEKG